ncbi:potassium-transporting ATPase subunit C [Streptomyces sp. NPDC096176]|uniref:potassium-transporting ATPase subunit C n=1 Tax=Streptomyces sp. NPDC096176 TaxID=3366079 RepID=UPI0037F10BE2
MNSSLGDTARLVGAGLRALLVLTVICGVLSPLAVTGIAQALFPDRANGSEVKDASGRIVGSALIGQRYDLPLKAGEETPAPDLRWFQPRPSDAPADAVTSSGSGLDPHISPACAEYQVNRVAERNNLDVEQVEKLVEDHTEGRTAGFIGEPRVNVLQLNIALEALARS